jgi:crossover junction endodeoxyribonuclease RusA
VLRMPWPPVRLSPNARLHWRAKHRVIRSYRTECAAAVGMTAGRRLPPGRLLLDLTFHPPDRRSRDRDNMLASFKAGIDGMAQALGIDDSRFVEMAFRVGDPVAGGAVVARIGAAVALSPVAATGGSLLD